MEHALRETTMGYAIIVPLDASVIPVLLAANLQIYYNYFCMRTCLCKYLCAVALMSMTWIGVTAQTRDSLHVQQLVLDSFTGYGIPKAFITLCDSNGIMIDTMTVEPDYNSPHDAMLWAKKIARKKQVLMIKAEHSDYETTIQHVEIKASRQTIYKLPNLLMKRIIRESCMDELTVTATRVQLTYKNDTIVVDAQAFKIPEGSMLDELVARVPGAELKADGTIFMNGRKVDYLTLNGKDFFKGKNRIMLDNLPYYTVRHLKFYEKEMPASQMIHVDTGEKDYVMDVELKPMFSIGLMANAEAGGGTNERWMTRLFGLRFTKYSRITLFGGANNINEIRSLGSSGFGDGTRSPNGEEKTYLLGFGYMIDDRKDRFKEELEGTVNRSDRYDDSHSSREVFLSNDNVFSRSRDINNSRTFGSDISNKWQLKKSGITFTTHGNYNKHRNDMLSHSASFASDVSSYGSCLQILDSIFSGSVMMPLLNVTINTVFDKMKNDASSYSIDQKVDWDKKLPSGDMLWLSLQGNYVKECREQFSRYSLVYPNGAQPNNMQDRYIPYNRKGYSYNAHGQYIMQFLNGLQLRYIYGYTQEYSNAQSDLYRLDILGLNMDFGLLPSQVNYLQIIDNSNSYKSLYLNKKHDGRINAVHYINGKRFNLNILASIIINNKNESVRYWRSNQRYELCQNNWYIEPFVQFSLYPRNSKKRTYVRLEYLNNASTPNPVQRIDTEDTTNPLAIMRGNSDLKLSRHHKIELLASRGNTKQNMSVKMTTNIFDNLVANGFTYNRMTGVYTYYPINIKGNWNADAAMNYYTYTDKAKRLKLEGQSRFNYVHNVDLTQVEGYTNSLPSRVKHYVTSQNITLSYNKESLRLEAIGDFAWNVAKRELKNSNDISAFDFSYGLSGQYTFPWKIQLATDLKVYCRRGYEEPSMNRDEPVWNASVSRPFMKGKLVVKLDAFDVLNQLSGTRYFVNGQGRTETWQLTMPRYAMLRIAYKFNKNPKKE